MTKKKIRIGAKVKFYPLPTEVNFSKYEVIGTIVQIHKAHNWFRIEWGEHKLSTCKHFSDVGDSVILV